MEKKSKKLKPKLKNITIPERNISDNNYDKKFLNDFFDFYYESAEQVKDTGNMSETSSILQSIYHLLIIKLTNSYERSLLKDCNEIPKGIIDENNLFLRNIDKYISDYKESDHLSFFDSCDMLELITLKKEKEESKNVIHLCVPNFDSGSQLEDIRNGCIDGLFQYITSYGLFLGTEKPVNPSINNINLELVKIYYELYCNKYLLNELNDVVHGRTDLNSASPKIKLLYKHVPEDQIISLADICHYREFSLESFLVSYIVASDINYYKLSDIEEYFDEDTLYRIYDNSLDSFNDSVDDLYLKYRFKVKSNE